MMDENLNINNLSLDNECTKLLSISFINKYQVIPYAYFNGSLVVLIKNNFSYFLINKIKSIVELNISLLLVNDSEWSNIHQLINFSNKKINAIQNYQLNNEDNNDLLKENRNMFYNVEIENSPIVKLVDSIIAEAITLKSSDIHFEPMEKDIRVRIRVDGKLIEKTILPIESLNEIVSRIKVLASLDITKKLIPQDGKFTFTLNNLEYDIRTSILPTIYGERIALRILDVHKGILSLEELGLNDITYNQVLKLLHSNSGLILVVGPTGAGKSTTLQAFLSKNVLRGENIITVEDPVEYTIPTISQVQINEDAGLDFATCLKTILRHDPNIIMIGEIRDLETAQIACRASITGHLVYSTLHTNTSVGVINRLKDMSVENYLLVDALKGIVSQRLVRCLCPNCKQKQIISSFDAKFLDVDSDTIVYHAVGCGLCNMTGYLGRRGIYEIIIIDDEFKKLISENAVVAKYEKLIVKKKFQTLFESGKELILKGITSIEELRSVLN